MTADEKLKDIFLRVGKKYGYDRIGAEFVAYRDFKVKWTRSYKWADFQVSDYMMDAPDAAIEGLADTLFSRITGAEDKSYTPEMIEWITSEEFTRNKQPIYIRRSRNILRNEMGNARSLQESLDRLKELGLVDKDAHPYLTWTKEELSGTVGYCSTLMDTIVMSSAFDSSMIPESVLDFALYHELLIIKDGWVHFGKGEEFDIYEEEKKFPQWKEAESMIHRMCLHL